jgi:uncharacterized protein (DUF305 family)
MKSHYAGLAINLAVSTVIMYLVMFSMIDGLPDFYNNLNMFYMAIMMVAPMAILMLLTMGSMYHNRKVNIALYVGFVVLFVGAFSFTRAQSIIGDKQFLRSMIPHHSGAILMCREASLTDQEIISLCKSIIKSQQDEIEQMKRIFVRH